MNVRFIMFCFFLLLSILVISTGPVDEFIYSIKTKSDRVTFSQGDWTSRIEDMKKQKNVSPINARFDPIWKGIPGYNGLQIDEKETIERIKKEGSWDDRLVMYKEIPPQVQLEQLGSVPIYRGNPSKPMVSIMINVAWGDEYLPSILQTLEKNHVKATFFLDGTWTSKNPEQAKKIALAGHELGNHGYTHPDMRQLSEGRILQEIQRTNNVIQKATGIAPTVFAPPSGDFNQRVVDIATRNQLKTILWTADTVDWRKPSPAQWMANVRSKIGNGVLILMHPTASTAQGLPSLIKEIKERKLAIGTVSENLSSTRVSLVE